MRHHDWPERLAEFIESRRGEPFAFGTHDCCQFAAGAIEAITGDNPARHWAYANELGAARIIHEAGSLEAVVTEALGDPVHPSQAGRGDVVIAELDRGDTVGVCLGNVCAFAAEVGLLILPRTVARSAWKVH